MKKAIFIILSIFLLVVPAYATSNEFDKIKNELTDELSEFKNSLPEEVLDALPSEIWDANFSTLINDSLNEGNIFKKILNYIFFDIGKIIKSFSAILTVLLICSIFNMLSKSFSSELVKEAFSFASILCIALSVFKICTTTASLVNGYMNSICNVMEAFSPLMATLYVMTGNISTGAIASASMTLFISVIENFLMLFMLPIVNISLCFAIVKSIGKINISGISKLLKTSFTSITVFIMSILMFVLSCKNTLSQSADSLSIKTAKFAISSFIPIVGSTVNDALRTITSSLSLIKNSCGIVAIIAILMLVLPLIISLLLYRLAFSILSCTAKALNCNAEGDIIDEANSLFGFLLTLLICTSILFIFSLTILIKSTVIA